MDLNTNVTWWRTYHRSCEESLRPLPRSTHQVTASQFHPWATNRGVVRLRYSGARICMAALPDVLSSVLGYVLVQGVRSIVRPVPAAFGQCTNYL